MKNLISLLIIALLSLPQVRAAGPDNEDLVKKAMSVVDESARRANEADTTEKKISYASVLPVPDEKNVVITFTINADNRIHVVDVKGGYAFIDHYIKTSLEGKEIVTESAIPGINYIMTVKLPASV